MEPERPRNEHARAFDAGAAEKLSLLQGVLSTRRCQRVVDVGTGPGGVAAGIARSNPRREVIGVDRDGEMLALARRRHSQENLRFACADAREELPSGADLVLMSSLLHEVYSWSADGMAAVVRALRNAYRSLLPGGLLVIRDFVRPEGADTPVTMYHQRHDIREGRSLPDFVGRTFWPARLTSMAVSGPANVYATDLTSAHEFIWRKDHGGAWDYELRERYGFWSCSEASALLFRVGFSRVHADIRANRWVLANRVARRIQLRERASGRVVQPPVNQIVLFAER